jgi:hypothetical protein
MVRHLTLTETAKTQLDRKGSDNTDRNPTHTDRDDVCDSSNERQPVSKKTGRLLGAVAPVYANPLTQWSGQSLERATALLPGLFSREQYPGIRRIRLSQKHIKLIHILLQQRLKLSTVHGHLLLLSHSSLLDEPPDPKRLSKITLSPYNYHLKEGRKFAHSAYNDSG